MGKLRLRSWAARSIQASQLLVDSSPPRGLGEGLVLKPAGSFPVCCILTSGRRISSMLVGVQSPGLQWTASLLTHGQPLPLSTQGSGKGAEKRNYLVISGSVYCIIWEEKYFIPAIQLFHSSSLFPLHFLFLCFVVFFRQGTSRNKHESFMFNAKIFLFFICLFFVVVVIVFVCLFGWGREGRGGDTHQSIARQALQCRSSF